MEFAQVESSGDFQVCWVFLWSLQRSETIRGAVLAWPVLRWCISLVCTQLADVKSQIYDICKYYQKLGSTSQGGQRDTEGTGLMVDIAFLWQVIFFCKSSKYTNCFVNLPCPCLVFSWQHVSLEDSAADNSVRDIGHFSQISQAHNMIKHDLNRSKRYKHDQTCTSFEVDFCWCLSVAQCRNFRWSEEVLGRMWSSTFWLFEKKEGLDGIGIGMGSLCAWRTWPTLLFSTLHSNFLAMVILECFRWFSVPSSFPPFQSLNHTRLAASQATKYQFMPILMAPSIILTMSQPPLGHGWVACYRSL